MTEPQLVLILPQGSVVATRLGIQGLARHLSPGSGKHFHGRTLFLELRLQDGLPAFQYLDEGSWRDAQGDTIAALKSLATGKRTKTALSNSGFSCTPLDAIVQVNVVKTGGEVLPLEPLTEILSMPPGDCPENTTPQEIARLAGQPEPPHRRPRLYLVLSPIELLVVSNLTPAEYAWYATRRPGKVFRQCCFVEVRPDHAPAVTVGRYQECIREISEKPTKKTKTVALTNLLNQVPFHHWVGYDRKEEGGVYLADRSSLRIARFPENIPWPWEKAP